MTRKSKVVKPERAAWRKPKRRKLERDIEKSCKQWARDHGWWTRKFKSPGNRSVPDSLFAKNFFRRCRILAVEFKRPGKESTDLQVQEQQDMRAAGWEVYVIDNREAFVALFEKIAADESWLS